MNKNIKKIFVVILTLTILFTSTLSSYEETKALGVEIVVGTLTVMFLGACIVGCDYVHNPDKYKDLGNTMKDFKNTTVENQKKLYKIEKANFEMVMQKAVDSNVGTCLIGSNGTMYSAKQLQSQEYPNFDTWKGYKEKESEKPKPSLWNMFELGSGLADLICAIWPDGKSPLPDGGSGSDQLYYTGDDGYIDENGKFNIEAHTRCILHNVDYNGIVVDNPPVAVREYDYSCNGQGDTSTRLAFYMDTSATFVEYRYDVFDRISYDAYVTINGMYCNQYLSFSTYGTINDNLGFSNETTSQYFVLCTSVAMNDNSDKTSSDYHLWTYLSTNAPVFDSYQHMQDYLNNGSLIGLLNGTPEASPTPTFAPASDSHIGPVRQYTNYFRNTFSPSMMANYVNYNIYNNWDGDSNTFNINNYTVEESNDSEITVTPTPDLRKPTFTPIPPDTDSGDTNNYDINITNNLLIEQTNIIQNISETVNNIYNFFQIDVDVIVEDLTPDTDSKFLPLYDMITDVNKLIPQDEFEVIEGQAEPIISTLYPKVTIKVPLVLDDFLSFSDKKIMEKDGDKVIILCDFYDFRIYFARFRKFLQIVIYIGMFFYLMKEFSVIWSIQ